MSRVNFLLTVKRLIAERAGYLCSRPNCPNPYTVGPLGIDERTCLGDAAHIRAASGDGPRGVEGVSEDDLRSVENGIWLCARCHRLVDGDEGRFTIEVLSQWKVDAELRARERLEGFGVDPNVRVPDLLPAVEGFWRAGLVAHLPLGCLPLSAVEPALGASVIDGMSLVTRSHVGRVPILLDADGLVVALGDKSGEGFRVRATQLGQLEVSIAYPFGPGIESDTLPFNADRSVDPGRLIQGVSFLMRVYCAYGRNLAPQQATVPGARQVFLLDVEGAGMRVPSAMVGGKGDAVGVATVNVFTPVQDSPFFRPAGGIPAVEQTVRAVWEMFPFFRDKWGGLYPDEAALRQQCAACH